MPDANAFALIGSNAVFASLAISSVALRFWIRKTKSIAIRSDDYLIMAAMSFTVALAITSILGVPLGGIGEPSATLDDAMNERFLKIFFIHQLLYLAAIAFVKLSVLALYTRICVNGRFPLLVKTMILVTTAWLVACIIATLFYRWPLESNWTLGRDDVDTRRPHIIHISASATDVVLNLVILCIPVVCAKTLSLARKQKIALGAILGLGMFCVAASITRLVYAVELMHINSNSPGSPRFKTAAINTIIWSTLSASAATITANLPTYTPFVYFAKPSKPTTTTTSTTPALTKLSPQPSIASNYSSNSANIASSRHGTRTSSTSPFSSPTAANTKYYNARWPTPTPTPMPTITTRTLSSSHWSSSQYPSRSGDTEAIIESPASVRTVIVGGETRGFIERDVERGEIRLGFTIGGGRV